MAKIVNLTRFRKQTARDAARRAGDANAARFGRSRAEREAEAAEAGRAARQLDAHRREEAEGDPPGQDAPPRPPGGHPDD